MTGHEQRTARFEELWDVHSASVLAYAVRRVGESRAPDVLNEAYLVAWRRMDDLPADPLPWLLAVARNVIRNDGRRHRRAAHLLMRLGRQREESVVSPETSVPLLSVAMRRLPEGDREVLMLVLWDGLDHARAARVLGCSAGAVAVRLHRARKRLRRELIASGWQPVGGPRPTPCRFAPKEET